MPTPWSPQAHDINALFWWLIGLSAVIFAIVLGVIVVALVRDRARPGAGEPVQRFGSTRVEVAWTVAPLVTLVVIFVFTVRTMRAVDPPAPPSAQPDLIVVGHQWWWEVRYPSAHVVTANEVHLPVGRRMLARLEAADVIHDFWVPRLGRKMDLVPGHPNQLYWQLSRAGVIEGACAEYCGAEHAWMRIRVVAQTEAEFDAWLRAQSQPAPAPGSAQAREGAALFERLACGNCHAIAGTSFRADVAPDLTHLASRATLGAGVSGNSRDDLARWLADPQQVKPGVRMPNFQLTSGQVQSLVAFLAASP